MTLPITPTTTAPHMGRKTPVVLTAASALLVLALATGLGFFGASRSAETGRSERGAAAALPETGSRLPASRTAEMAPTMYLVESDAQAQRLREALADVDAIGAAQGQPAAATHVVWFDSAEAETRFQRAMTELDTLSGGLGLAPVSVIDLRTPAGGGAVSICATLDSPTEC